MGRNKTTRYLHLGCQSIEICFGSQTLARLAAQRLNLQAFPAEEILGKVIYKQDPAVSRLLPEEFEPNCTYIREVPHAGDRKDIHLKIFNQFCVSLEISEAYVNVRYAPNTPPSHLFDDVLHIALQSLLKRIGGFFIHGACLVLNGQALVLTGNAGAGKSTTAFTLQCAGFDYFADDAALVTLSDNGLIVWPLVAELSLRASSFDLLKQNGIDRDHCRRERDKYFFTASRTKATSAKFKCLCFLRATGESETHIKRLSSEETLHLLYGDERHVWSEALERSEAKAEILVEQVPNCVRVELGTDLDKQISALGALVDAPEISLDLKSPPIPSRKEKQEVIRNTWKTPGKNCLAEAIPLLGDWDTRIVPLTHALLQNIPWIQLVPEGSINTSVFADTQLELSQNRLPWYPFEIINKGCSILLGRAQSEAIKQYAHSWFSSAPSLAPHLLWIAIRDNPEQAEQLLNVWHKFCSNRVDLYGEHIVSSISNEPLDDMPKVIRVLPIDRPCDVERFTALLLGYRGNEPIRVAPSARKLESFNELVPRIYKRWQQQDLPVRLLRSFPIDAVEANNVIWMLEHNQLKECLPFNAKLNGSAKWKTLERPPQAMEIMKLNLNCYLTTTDG